jgi:enoyl reductase
VRVNPLGQRLAVSLFGSVALVLAVAAPGRAGTGDGDVNGTADGQVLTSRVRYDTSNNYKGPSAVPLAAVDGDWTPPPCWSEPQRTPEGLKEYAENVWWPSIPTTGSNAEVLSLEDHYKNGKPYTNFNIGKKGSWWSLVVSPTAAPGAALDCLTSIQNVYDWVGEGEPAPPANAIDARTLALLAAAQIRVPDTTVSMNPGDTVAKTVNLPTWVWLNPDVFKPVSVRASLNGPGFALSATTTAAPDHLHIDPGTSEATVFPGGGATTDCPFENGHIGQAYQPGQKGNPLCGVTYEHSTTNGPFQLRATLTWRISWTSSTGEGGNLANGTFGKAVPVDVPEVQVVNGSH